jgi:hypothetical protein
MHEVNPNYIIRIFVLFTLHKYHSGDQIKKNDMGGACSTYGEE